MRGFAMGWGIRILIIALIGGGALIFRDRLSSDAGSLKVGDCYDDPAAVTEIRDVQHHPCTEGHTAEVVFVGKMTGEDAVYPADSVVEAWVSANCVPAWNAYTGKSIDTETVLGLGYYQPTDKGWGKGDRDIICYAGRVDGAPMTATLRIAQ
jgi:hypothetical protein